MTLHLVTDRRRLAPDADAETAARCLLDQAQHAVAAGIDVIQLRERDLEGRALVDLTRALVRATRRSRTRVVVNDRLDVALAAMADGVHLRSDSFDAARVRACTRPGFLIGRSVHAQADVEAAGPVDYLIAGTVWPTVSKPADHGVLGLEGLAGIVRAAQVPVLAIGGIQLIHARDVAACGAAGLAGIGLWLGAEGDCRAIALDQTVRAFREAFDAANMGTNLPAD